MCESRGYPVASRDSRYLWDGERHWFDFCITRIAKAVKQEQWYLVKRLRYLLTNSHYAKLLAVRRVTQNKGKKTAGIDGAKWITSNSKMNDNPIDFKNMDWESPVPGIQYKAYVRGNQRIRLVEFSEDFNEPDWCTRGHVGYVLEGRLTIDFDGKLIDFMSGDGIFIPEGEENRHKGKVARGEKALVILFEEV